MKSQFKIFVSFIFLMTSMHTFANTLPSPKDADSDGVADADVIFLRKDCGSMANCAETMSEIITWMNQDPYPGLNGNKLLIEIGPGTFGKFQCSGLSNVTLRGSGQDQTIVQDPIVPGLGSGALIANDCFGLSFHDLTFLGDYGILWRGGGTSTYSNVNVAGGTYGWYDNGTCGTKQAEHFWFGSRIISHANFTTPGSSTAYYSQCGTHWVYGGDIAAFARSTTSTMNTQNAIRMEGGDIRVFGSSVRVIANSDASADYPNGLVAVIAKFGGGGPKGSIQRGGTVHMHGAIVNATAKVNDSQVSIDVVGIQVDSDGTVHTPGTAFTLIPNGAGTVSRIVGSGNVQSPFQWPKGVEPPVITSTSGSDMFVETDCSEDGDCQTLGSSQTHLMIYNPSCATDGPWLDVNTNRCRGDTGQ